jgi:hypothetical protein
LTTGINDLNETKEAIKAFPNPFSDKINLTNMTGKEHFTLYNYFGQIMWTGKYIEQKDFSELNRGLYFLKIDDITIKLIKE